MPFGSDTIWCQHYRQIKRTDLPRQSELYLKRTPCDEHGDDLRGINLLFELAAVLLRVLGDFLVLLALDRLGGKRSPGDGPTGMSERQFERREVNGAEGRGILPFIFGSR